MLTCYVIAHSLWMEVRTQHATQVFNVDNINYVYANDGFPNEIVIATNDSKTSLYLERVTISDFNDCLTKAYDK